MHIISYMKENLMEIQLKDIGDSNLEKSKINLKYGCNDSDFYHLL